MMPRVLDLSHHNTVNSFSAVSGIGVWGIIHKSSQGTAYVDPMYVSRRAAAKSAGLLWGAYHFATGDDVESQVDWFLKCASPDDNTLLALDYEPNRLSQMSISQVVEFLHEIEDRLGRKAVIYSGNSLKENIASLNQTDRDYVASHRLWLPQYGPTAHVPTGFKNWWLWQYTDGTVNRDSTTVPGISGLIDRNAYSGSREQLTSEWVS